MRFRRVTLILALAVFVACAVYVLAQVAVWKPAQRKYTWDYRFINCESAPELCFCTRAEQCLVWPRGNESWDDHPEQYWLGRANADKPKCIDTGQYISDHYCEGGDWSSRTKLVAMQLLGLALDESPGDFELYCDNYKNVLNEYEYLTDFGPVTAFLEKNCKPFGGDTKENCANNICVLNIPDGVAFGMSINTPIDGDQSHLQALNKSKTLCDSAKNDDGDYDPCGENVWYNHNTESILYVPISGVSLPPPPEEASAFFYTPYIKIKDYVFSAVHNLDVNWLNYTFFNVTTPHFDQVYFVKKGSKEVFSFKQTDFTLSKLSFTGFYLGGVTLPSNFCDEWIKKVDEKASCEVQPYTKEFYIVAYEDDVGQTTRSNSLVDEWHELTGKLRVG